MITLGARDFSSVVSGFCQVFIVSRFAARSFDLRQTPKIPAAREKNLSYRWYQMMGIELNCTPGKRWGGEDPGGESESAPCPFPILPSIVFFMNFSPALYYLNACNRLREGASGMQEKTPLIES